jgi:hypothetical protein
MKKTAFEEAADAHHEFIKARGEEHDDGCMLEAARTGGGGPAKVTNDAYRDGWDSIFGKQPVPDA